MTINKTKQEFYVYKAISATQVVGIMVYNAISGFSICENTDKICTQPTDRYFNSPNDALKSYTKVLDFASNYFADKSSNLCYLELVKITFTINAEAIMVIEA